MTSSNELLNLQAALGHPEPPTVIWQRPKHFWPPALYQTLLDEGGALPPQLLTIFCNDLMNQDRLQPELVRFLLPHCLIGWKQALCQGETGFAPMASHLWGGFESPHFDRTRWFTNEEWQAVQSFMSESLLEHMALQRTLGAEAGQADPYRWMRHFASYCVVFPELEPVWDTWWSLNPVGFAYCAVQYLSRLIYLDEENPIFNPAGDPDEAASPRLWDTEHPGKGCHPDNAAFLKRVLTPSFVTTRLDRAVSAILRSSAQHEMLLSHVERTAAAQTERIAFRLVQLPGLLQDPLLSYDGWDTQLLRRTG